MAPLPRSVARIALNVVVDAVLAALAIPAARWIADPGQLWLAPLWALPLGSVCLLAAGIPFRLSLQYWRFAGLRDLLGVAASSAIGAVLLTFILRESGVSLGRETYPIIQGLTFLFMLGAPRVIYRHIHANRAAAPDRSAAQPVLLIGAGEAADLFMRALMQDRQPAYRVVGLLTSAARQTGRRIHGCPIVGTLDGSEAVLERLRQEGRLPQLLVVTAPDLTGPALARLLEQSDRLGLQVRRAPRPTALAPASEILALKPVAIEDLLNRPQVPLDREGMARLVQGRRVLVTGAGGTIGSELARQVAALGPEKLTLLDNGEYALWQIDLELAETHPQVLREAVIADIRDDARVRSIFDRVRPELVFHAAALKHVPMVEANPLEGLLTNVAGSRHVADAARAVGAQAMVLISTDKAVNPTSVMGASKRLAEMYCQALDIAARAAGSGIRCITVRFGNVLGSTGSVVPLFRRQLERGGPLTVTHPDMQRYFMTVREAVGLVLEASVVGLGAELGQDGGIFVLDMGKPVKIVDLARQMIRLAGLRPDQDVEIRFTGLRPGEKLYEELFHGREPPEPTGHEGLLMATPRTADPAIVGRAIDEIAVACRSGQVRLALATLARMVPEFEHNADGMQNRHDIGLGGLGQHRQ
jgi:O-antigen biosynthesis protein WbqV